MDHGELRFYCFVNFYLSSIQQGVQTGHCAVDLVMRYLNDENQPVHSDLVKEWATFHKTFIILNGGNAEGITNATRIIADSDFPWASFYEDGASLGGIQTCVGVVLPEEIFKAQPAAPNDDGVVYEYTQDPVRCVNCGRVTPQSIEACDRWDCSHPKQTVIRYTEGHAHLPLIGLLKSCRLAQ